MERIIVFAERILPSTQTFIPTQINQLRSFSAVYAGLLPAEKNYELQQPSILLRQDRSASSRLTRELYRWTGSGASYHARLRKTDARLIHAHFAEGSSAAVFLSRELNLPLIMNLWGGAELMTEANLRSKWFEWPYLAYRQSLWKRASAFLCASEYVRRRAVGAGFPAEKVHVQLAGLDTQTFTPRLPVTEKDNDLVLFIGRLVPYKGCDYLIRAMKLVRQERPQARLVVIGDGVARPELEQLAQSLRIECKFLGELKQAELRPWLEKARVFCAPSVTLADGQSEAFGVVFLEAQAMGVPVVSFRHGGIPETMHDGITGLLAEERDERGLAAHLLRYLRDDDFWLHSREEGMRWVRKGFDHHVQAARLERIYRRAIDGFRSDAAGQFLQAA